MVVVDARSPRPRQDESEAFAKRWGFDWRAADLDQLRACEPASGLLWNFRLHGMALPFEKYDQRPAMHWKSYAETPVYRQRADQLVSDINITANKNTVPFDPESPFVTSGLRLGSAALTTRGFDTAAFVEVADVIADRLQHPEDAAIELRCRERVAALVARFPLYGSARELQPV